MTSQSVSIAAVVSLIVAGCSSSRSGDMTSFTSAEDAAATAALEGTWSAETPAGIVRMALCEEVPGENNGNGSAYDVLDSGSCVAHVVAGAGRGKTEDVDIDATTTTVDDGTFFGGREERCAGVVITPLVAALEVEEGCTYGMHGAVIYATHNEDDPYAPPFELRFQLDAVHYERPSASFDGDVMALTFMRSLACSDEGTGPAAEATAHLRRESPDGCE